MAPDCRSKSIAVRQGQIPTSASSSVNSIHSTRTSGSYPGQQQDRVKQSAYPPWVHHNYQHHNRLKREPIFSKQNYWLNEPFCILKEEEGQNLISPFLPPPLRLEASLVVAKRGFFPGEYMTFELTLANCVHGSVRKMRVRVVQKNICGPISGHKKISKAIVAVNERLIPFEVGHVGRGEIFWASELLLPNDLPSSTQLPNKSKNEQDIWTDRGIQVSYYVEFVLKMTGKKGGLCGSAPIAIGGGGDDDRVKF